MSLVHNHKTHHILYDSNIWITNSEPNERGKAEKVQSIKLQYDLVKLNGPSQHSPS